MKIKTIYIDDDEKDLKKYENKFKQDPDSRNKFDIVSINVQKPLKDLLEELKDHNPELILIDFKLNKPKAGVLIGISGVALSAALRENFPDIPLVLFTRRDVFKIENYSYSEKILVNLDKILYKSDAFNEGSLDSLYGLAIGFKKLRETKSKKWIDLFKLIGAPEEEYERLRLSNPYSSKKEWSVLDAADWIRKILIKYPGILYDPIHSATFLGISERAFLSTQIKKFFDEAKYKGVFAPPEGRWWRSRLQEIAVSIMNDKEINLPLNKGFPFSWERTYKESIEKSKCIFSGESYPEWVCYILKKPVMIKYSLSYRPDSRPEVMDEARVSFEAIITSNDVEDELFCPSGKELLEKIRKIPKVGK